MVLEESLLPDFFKQIFGNAGTLLQPTPQNKPHSQVRHALRHAMMILHVASICPAAVRAALPVWCTDASPARCTQIRASNMFGSCAAGNNFPATGCTSKLLCVAKSSNKLMLHHVLACLR